MARKAFVAEDSADTRVALQQLLQGVGFELAGSASTEAEALAWLAANGDGWHVAIVDLLLLDGSGFNVLRRFKEAPQGGKVIVFSGFVSQTVRERCERLGADAVLVKSELPRLLKILEGLARGPS